MRTTSSALLNLINLAQIETFLLVEYGVVSGGSPQFAVTTLGYDVSIYDTSVGYRTYYKGTNLVAVDNPRLSSTVDREAFKIAFTDIDNSMRADFDNGVYGKELKIYMGFINKSTASVTDSGGNTIAPGEAFKDTRDMFIMYAGAVDGQSIDYDLASSKLIATIECASPMASLDMKKIFLTSKESMRAKYPNDSSFDEVHVGSGQALMKWGRV